MSLQCTLCGSQSVRLLFVKNSYPIVKCQGCGLIFVHPVYSNGFDPRDSYEENYFCGEIYKDYIAESHFRLQLFERKLSFIQRYIPKSGRLLDVGCATGLFLETAKRRGYEVFGVEISEYAVRHMTESISSQVFMGELKEARFSDEFFDVITMWDVLEHLRDPVQVMRETNRILKRDGIVVIETVNTSCLNAKLLGERWPLYAPPHHLFYFSVNTLTTLLSKSGFYISKVEPIQTYSPFHSHKAIRYFDKSSVIRKTLRRFFGDVLLVVARK